MNPLNLRCTVAVAGIAAKDTFRRPGYWIVATGFSLVAALSAVPFSPGVPAPMERYQEAGIFTLLAGSFCVTLCLLPFLLRGPGGGWGDEALRSLPVSPYARVTGLFTGFILGLLVYFVLGGLLLCLAGLITIGPHDLPIGIAPLIWGFFQAMVVAAVVLLFSRVLSWIPAVGASILIWAAGQTRFLLPRPVSFCLPALDSLDPWTMASGAVSARPDLALIHGLTWIALCLTLAGLCQGRITSRK